MRRRYTEAERERFFEEVRAGVTVAKAASRQGVSHSTAYLWLKQSGDRSAREKKLVGKEVVFARAVRMERTESTGEVRVQVGSASVHVERGFDAELLRTVVLALGGAHS
jgi:transposase-like protein